MRCVSSLLLALRSVKGGQWLTGLYHLQSQHDFTKNEAAEAIVGSSAALLLMLVLGDGSDDL